jgi:hypothetical protein
MDHKSRTNAFNRFNSDNAVDPRSIEEHADQNVKHWEHRQEENWQKFQFNQPYARGLKKLKEQVLPGTNFDPATLWQWGTMQAMALIEMLQAVEKKFGREGQTLMLESLHKVGYDIGRQITDGTEYPEGMPVTEWMSYYATIINRIAYASLESPNVVGRDEVNFHIDWCPHQDEYGSFDCRVQRYFVQGMIDAAMDYVREQGVEEDTQWDVAFKKTIPDGGHTCFFEIKKGNPEDRQRWTRYTEALEKKALRIAAGRDDSWSAKPEIVKD